MRVRSESFNFVPMQHDAYLCVARALTKQMSYSGTQETHHKRHSLFGTRSQNEKGGTPLTWAARVGNSESVAWLIGRGAGVDSIVDSSTTDFGGTPRLSRARG